jgi:hypothetical protein
MATKKPKGGSGKARKLTLKKSTIRDLTAPRDAAGAIRGGAARNDTYNYTCSCKNCTV